LAPFLAAVIAVISPAAPAPTTQTGQIKKHPVFFPSAQNDSDTRRERMPAEAYKKIRRTKK
jgi:hypothetical protein